MVGFFRKLVVPVYDNSFFPYLLRKPALTFYVVVIFCVNFLSGIYSPTAMASSITEDSIIEETNNERAAYGLSILSANSQLTAAAYAKAQDIFEYQYWSHYGPEGQTPWDFILSSGYDYVYAGENLAKGFSSSEALMSAWMASKSHRENIINANYSDIGVAVVSGDLQGSNVILVVQMFGSLVATPPALPVTSQLGASAASQIEILYPSNDTLTSDNLMEVRGQSSVNISTIDVLDNSNSAGTVICEDGIWNYRPEAHWSEGAHDVSAVAEDTTTSDSVHFDVDTTSPIIIDSSLNVERISNSDLNISVEVQGEPDVVSLVSGNLTQDMSTSGSDYSLQIALSDISENANTQILASDVAGNLAVLDITSNISELRDTEQSPLVVGSLGGSSARSFNLVVLAVLAVLFIIDGYFLIKLNIFTTRGKTLFPMALCILIIIVGIFAKQGVIS